MTLSLHYRLVIGFKIPAWARARARRNGLSPFGESPFHFVPILLVLFSSAIATRTSSRDDRIKHFATTIYDTFVGDARRTSPRKVSRRRVLSFSLTPSRDIAYIHDVRLKSPLFIHINDMSLLIDRHVIYCARKTD